jgi:dienelactone hydrolase
VRRPVLLLLLAFVVLAGRPVAADGPPRPPPPPAQGFGAPLAAPAVVRGAVENPSLPSATVTWLRPATATADGPSLPVVVFLHGFGARGPEPYLALLEHLARRGAAVVYPVYPALDARAKHSRYDTMWVGVEAGLDAVRASGARLDVGRLGVVGHSFGGGAAPAIAARASARGLGRDALFVACLAPWYDLDADAWAALPSHALLGVVLYEDDVVCDPAIGAGFCARATTLAAGQKAVRVFRSDAHGRPAIAADHLAPLTAAGVDALDLHGTWRVLDALAAAAAGSPEGRAVAVGADAGALALGTWSDGTPVAPARATWTEASGTARSGFRPGGVQETSFRRLLRTETWSTLPLPDPARVPPARLPPSERFVDRPPATPVTVGAGATPRLLVESAAPAIDGEARLVAAGVRVERVDALPATPPSAMRGTTAMLLDADGRCILWKPADDPRLVEVVLVLVGTR